MTGEIEVEGKNVIVIDDLTKSGSTLLHSREMLLEQGAKEVGLVVLHVTPIAKKGEKLLENLVRRSNEMVVTSNTVYTSTFCENYPELSMDVTDKIVQTLVGL
jgi:phosphoribosylpyrophosphate synthetase